MNKLLFSQLFLLVSFFSFAEKSAKILDESLWRLASATSKPVNNANLDKIALHYCQNTGNTYVAIIWPRAIEHLEGMKEILSTAGKLIYQKGFELRNDAPILLYELAHPGFYPEKLKKHIKNYIPMDMAAPYQFYAILFESDKCLAELTQIKQVIRDYVGISYWSIHIDDYHYESLNMAHLIFQDDELNKINHKPYVEPIFLTQIYGI
jgi:hypothetical protein